MSAFAQVLYSVASSAEIVAPSLPQPWSLILIGIVAALRLAAGLIEHGISPEHYVREMRSALPDIQDARREIQQHLQEVTQGFPGSDAAVIKGASEALHIASKSDPSGQGDEALLNDAVHASLALLVDLLAAGVNPAEVITEMRSCLPDVEAAKAVIQQHLQRVTAG